MTIPDWNDQAVILPVRDGHLSSKACPSTALPTRTIINQVIDRFSTTPYRTHSLNGLSNYRTALYDGGIEQGFQWLSGNFVENVETRTRPGQEPRPYEVDVATL